MTTPEERQRIYKLYVELKFRRKAAEATMNSNCTQFRQIWDEVEEREYQKEELIRERNYASAKGIIGMADGIWAFFKGLYSLWDIELAIQEGEGRIGNLPYTKERS